MLIYCKGIPDPLRHSCIPYMFPFLASIPLTHTRTRAHTQCARTCHHHRRQRQSVCKDEPQRYCLYIPHLSVCLSALSLSDGLSGLCLSVFTFTGIQEVAPTPVFQPQYSIGKSTEALQRTPTDSAACGCGRSFIYINAIV